MKGRADYKRTIGAVRQSKQKQQQVDETSPAERSCLLERMEWIVGVLAFKPCCHWIRACAMGRPG